MTYEEFVNVYNASDRTSNYYWAESNIPDEIVSDVIEPELGIILNLEATKIWQVQSTHVYFYLNSIQKHWIRARVGQNLYHTLMIKITFYVRFLGKRR